MGFGFRKEFSSARAYAISAATGGLFGAASPGKAASAYAKESKLTIGAELKFFKSEAKELGQSIGQRLDPRHYSFKLNQNVLGSSGAGFEIKLKPCEQKSTNYNFRAFLFLLQVTIKKRIE
jgi:hypothetical protein